MELNVFVLVKVFCNHKCSLFLPHMKYMLYGYPSSEELFCNKFVFLFEKTMFIYYFWLCWAQMVKHLHTMRETRVQSLGREDLLEKEMTAHSSTLAW